MTDDELQRAKTGLKAGTIMQGEIAPPPGPARSPTTYFMRGRIRTLDEIKDAIDGVTVDQVNAFLKKHTPGPFTIVIVGPKARKCPRRRGNRRVAKQYDATFKQLVERTRWTGSRSSGYRRVPMSR